MTLIFRSKSNPGDIRIRKGLAVVSHSAREFAEWRKNPDR